MSRMKELRANLADAHKDFKAAVEEVRTAESPEAKQAAKVKADAAKAKFEEIQEDIALEQVVVDQAKAAAVASPTSPSQLEVQRQNRAAGVTGGIDNIENDPKRGFKDHKDFLIAVMAVPSGRVDDRLKGLRQATQGSDEHGAYSDPYGGFLIPTGVLPGVLSIQSEDDPIMGRTTPVTPMRTPQVKINARVDEDHSTSVSGGLVVTRRPETVDGSSSRMKFRQIEINAHELFGFSFATESILNDSPESFLAILNSGFRDEFAGNHIEECLNGSGNGEYLGVMNAGCLITVSKEAGQGADTILTENIDKMRARCWRYGRAIWMANHDTYPQLRGLVRTVGTGGNQVNYLTTDPNGQQMLDGRPIFFTEYCQTLGDKGDLVLAVWSEYLEGEYQPLRQAESVHVRFLANERAFKFWKRNDGQPWWRVPLTPKRSSSTLSPFVVLQAR